MVIHCYVAHGDPCCVVYGDPLLCCMQQSTASHAAMHQGQLMARAMAMQWMYMAGCNVVRPPYQLPLRAPPAVNLQVGAEEATAAKSEALVLEAKSSVQSGLKMPPPLLILQEALIE